MIFDEFLVDDLNEELEYEFWYDDKGRVVAKIPIGNNNPETYNLLTSLVIKYANNYGEYKRERILKSWNLNPQQT